MTTKQLFTETRNQYLLCKAEKVAKAEELHKLEENFLKSKGFNDISRICCISDDTLFEKLDNEFCFEYANEIAEHNTLRSTMYQLKLMFAQVFLELMPALPQIQYLQQQINKKNVTIIDKVVELALKLDTQTI